MELNPVEALAQQLGVSVDAVQQVVLEVDGRQLRLAEILTKIGTFARSDNPD